MESLLANYASSGEEEEQQNPQPPPLPSSSPHVSSLVSTLPQPKSSSPFTSLPQPKQPPKTPIIPVARTNKKEDYEVPKPSIPRTQKPSNLFSSLPLPISQTPQQPPNPPNVKRIVQFKLPINPNNHDDDDDDEEDDEEEKERRRRRESQTLAHDPSVKSFLSSIPAPRNSTTLGVAPSSGSGRRSIIETHVPTLTSATFEDKNEASIEQNAPNYSNYDLGKDKNAGNSMNYSDYVNYQSSIDQNSGNYGNYELGSDQNLGNYANYANYSSYQSSSVPNAGSVDVAATYGTGSYESFGNYPGQYENNWADGSAATTLPETTGMAEIGVKVKGKRGRNELPTEIVEVKQDELMKNRPREDQVKMTGIAFGPSYQPASTKGKPSKLHKRKHQIGSLFFDMKQKEMELQERRSRGLLTKAETQAKYGW